MRVRFGSVWWLRQCRRCCSSSTATALQNVMGWMDGWMDGRTDGMDDACRSLERR